MIYPLHWPLLLFLWVLSIQLTVVRAWHSTPPACQGLRQCHKLNPGLPSRFIARPFLQSSKQPVDLEQVSSRTPLANLPQRLSLLFHVRSTLKLHSNNDGSFLNKSNTGTANVVDKAILRYDEHTGKVRLSNRYPTQQSFYAHFIHQRSDLKFNSIGSILSLPDMEWLLRYKLVDVDDVKYLWDGAYERSPGSISIVDLYELYCSIIDLIDPEIVDYLNEAFQEMKSSFEHVNGSAKRGVAFKTFASWDVILEAVELGSIDLDWLQRLWVDELGSLDVLADRLVFGKLYAVVGQAIDDAENGSIEATFAGPHND